MAPIKGSAMIHNADQLIPGATLSIWEFVTQEGGQVQRLLKRHTRVDFDQHNTAVGVLVEFEPLQSDGECPENIGERCASLHLHCIWA
jgi:hypothetical protein